MDRRNFLKQGAAIAVVGAVAPKVLAEPVTPIAVFAEDAEHVTATYCVGVDTASGATTWSLAYYELMYMHRELFLDKETKSEA